MPPRDVLPLGDEEHARLVELAETALDEGDPERALEAVQEILHRAPRDAEALYLLAESQRDLGRVEEALDAYRRCVLAAPERVEAWSGLGTMHLFLLQVEEARKALNRAVREDPSYPDAWYARALVRERKGDLDGADRDLARAARLDPETYPFPVPLTDEELEQAVEEAISRLHPTLKDYLANVAILVDEVPAEDVLQQYDPPISPGELLGYFSGYSLMERSLDNPWSQLPSSIVLFRRNLQRYAQNHDHLVEELKITIYHEVGHFLGLDEDDLKERGLE